MNSTIVASILHGAYGDYYEQAVCLKSFRLSHPETRLKLFAAASHRLQELRVLDFSWADCFEMHTEIANHKIDRFWQFQVRDQELRAGVLSKLPPELLQKLEPEHNRLPWRYLRSILPLNPEQQIGLSDLGRSMLPTVMRENGINAEVFQRPTIGFLWRYRSSGGAIKAKYRTDPQELAAKYSRLFRRLIDRYGCHIFICGMKVPRTQENKKRIDAKYPEYGLDLPAESCTHLKGLSWALELEILSRCTLCVANPSGFSEALWIKRGGSVVLVDPSFHYLAKAVRHRVPFFRLHRATSLISAMTSGWESICFAAIRTELNRLLRQSARGPFESLQNSAS
jgi:hypothetical protein